MTLTRALSLALLLLAAPLALAQQSARFDQFELHHSVVYTTFLSPEVASQYGLVRGEFKAILTVSVRDADAGETAGRPVEFEGETWDLIHAGPLEFREIRDGQATYYIAPFEFIDREWRFFEFDFTPSGSDKTYHHKFKTQLWKQEP